MGSRRASAPSLPPGSRGRVGRSCSALSSAHRRRLGAARRARGGPSDAVPPRPFARDGPLGARPVVAEPMLALLSCGLDPVVPEHGSLGASGDLAPNAHCGLALIGEGEVWNDGGERVPAGDALAAASIEPLNLRGAAQGRGRNGRDIDRSAAQDRPCLRPRPDRHAPPARPGAQHGQPHATARGVADRGQSPLRRPAGAGSYSVRRAPQVNGSSLIVGPALIAGSAQPGVELVLNGPLDDQRAPSFASSDSDSRGFSPTPTANSRSICSSISGDGGTVRLTA
jgi:aromatic amino acid lyase